MTFCLSSVHLASARERSIDFSLSDLIQQAGGIIRTADPGRRQGTGGSERSHHRANCAKTQAGVTARFTSREY